MKQRKRAVTPAQPADWQVSASYQHGRKTLEPGWALKIKGERGGTFTFARHVRTATGTEWIDCFGGIRGQYAWRSFRPERIVRASAPRK